MRGTDGIRHLFGVEGLERQVIDVITRSLLELLLLHRVLGVNTDRRRTPRLQLHLVGVGAHMPVLKYVRRLGREKAGRNRKRRLETTAGEELDSACFLNALDSELFDVLPEESHDLVLSKMPTDKIGEQNGEEVLKLPAYYLRNLDRELLAVLAWSLFVTLRSRLTMCAE
jgi:hypothetical protein